MNKKIEVKTFLARCVGTKACVFEDPDIFKFEDGKVYLHKPGNDETQVLVKDFAEEDIRKLVKAADLCPVNAISVKDIDSGEFLYDPEVKEEKDIKTIYAEYDDLKEFQMDKKGYFLIRINKEEKTIEVAFCPEVNKITVKIVGRKPLDIYQTIIKQSLISRMDHAAYLGRELQKAKTALDLGLEYVQDDELKSE